VLENVRRDGKSRIGATADFLKPVQPHSSNCREVAFLAATYSLGCPSFALALVRLLPTIQIKQAQVSSPLQKSKKKGANFIKKLQVLTVLFEESGEYVTAQIMCSK